MAGISLHWGILVAAHCDRGFSIGQGGGWGPSLAVAVVDVTDSRVIDTSRLAETMAGVALIGAVMAME